MSMPVLQVKSQIGEKTVKNEKKRWFYIDATASAKVAVDFMDLVDRMEPKSITSMKSTTSTA